jgi:Uma2 family endonuclease
MASAHAILETVSTGAVHGLPPFPSRSLPPGSELPDSDGEPMETERHDMQMHALVRSLADWAKGRTPLYVGGNMFVYYSERQVRGEHFRGPDVFVVLGASDTERRSWVLWEELKLPDVVIELTSESTKDVDHGIKKTIYARDWKTACYVLYDPLSHALEAYRLDAPRRRYVRIAPDARGDVEVAPLGLKLGLRPVSIPPRGEPPSLRWIDDAGEVVPLPEERERKRADDESRRADDEKRRADDEKRRADALEARLATRTKKRNTRR